MNKIHTTIGVYANGSMKMNGVCKENLKDHIDYNIEKRGRGFFVDGKCVYKGYLTDENVKHYEELFESDKIKYTITEDTAPYQ